MMLSVVIPAHNESGGIESTLVNLYTSLRQHSIPHELLVVNDHSTDATESILQRLTAEIPTLRTLDSPTRRGFGRAVRKGLENFRGDAVALVMADASDRPADLIRFYRTMIRTDSECVFGSRFMRGAQVVGYPFLKRVLNRLANNFIRALFGLRYNDVTNAFKLYRRHVIEGLAPLISQQFNLTVELPLKAIVRGYSYTILPNDWINRQSGVSKLRIQEMGSRYLFIVMHCFMERWLVREDYRRRQPAP